MTETFYDVLSVPPDAPTEEIEAAYRERVKETHPDVSDDPDAEDEFKRVTRARDVLTDESERAAYDRLGHDQYVAQVLDGPGEGASGDGTAPGGGTGRTESTASSGRTTADGTAGRDATGAGDAGTAGAADTGSATADSTGGPSGGTRHTQSRTGGGETTYATRTEYGGGSSDSVRLPLTPRTIILMGSMSVLYPVFVLASVLPGFPLPVNLVVGCCTLAIVAYLVSMPNVAVAVFGAWSVLAPLALVVLPGLSLFSPVGLLVPVAVWFPLCLALLTRAALRR